MARQIFGQKGNNLINLNRLYLRQL